MTCSVSCFRHNDVFHINECDMFHNLCVNGRCENVFGMFRCVCNQGYKLDITGGNCTDIDECQNPDNCQYGTCVNQLGTYLCQCPPNFESNPTGTGCVDTRSGNCYMHVPSYDSGRLGVCNDEVATSVSKATCCCTIGLGWGEVPGFCEPCPQNGTLERNNLCPGGPGFRPNKATLVLEDINECLEVEGICEGGECQNTFGSYLCRCPEGYRMDGEMHRCVDVNECLEQRGICGIGSCINKDGTYSCVCPDGHIMMPDGVTCMDMRKSRCFRAYRNTTLPPYTALCEPEDALTVDVSQFQCCCLFGAAWGLPCTACPARGSRAHRRLCEDGPITITEVNECDINPDLCRNGQCIDTRGSFRCRCHPGFVYNPITQSCDDEDECQRLPGPCIGNAQCLNMPGSYTCDCPDGYRILPDGRRCQDVDECHEVAGVCLNGQCLNLQGSFSCLCRPGFHLSADRTTCIDMDECIMHPGRCRNGSCDNMMGSYRCHCNPGFRLTDRGECEDVDECRTMLGLCENGRCINTPGSFTCQCQRGYTLAPTNVCMDVDECAGADPVCRRGMCQNVEGSYLCQCRDGYRMSRVRDECVDIDECREVEGACYSGRCENTEGGYLCVCPTGYLQTVDGKACIDIRKGLCYNGFQLKQRRRGDRPRHRPGRRPQNEIGFCTDPRSANLTKPECCCTNGEAWGATPRQCQLCPKPGDEAFQYLCPEGYGYISVSVEGVTSDVNECLLNPDICENGLCVNTDGSFRCECGPGYRLDAGGTKCIDKDECLDSGMCGNGTCVNGDGSFNCMCHRGFEPGPHGTCQDVDECESPANQCAFRCFNMPGTFRCVCPMGYKVAADMIHCQDVDECATPANKYVDECSTPANQCRYACKNTVGSFLCVCPEGYVQRGADDCVGQSLGASLALSSLLCH
ncbi:hypothetical protein ACOMHN_012134 [Nucella lapillus]